MVASRSSMAPSSSRSLSSMSAAAICSSGGRALLSLTVSWLAERTSSETWGPMPETWIVRFKRGQLFCGMSSSSATSSTVGTRPMRKVSSWVTTRQRLISSVM